MNSDKFLTLFTPTYNRVGLLPRLYESLKAQTNRDFIWLIIDDGSTDATQELVDKWISQGDIEIEYHWKQNGGKHTAMNLAYKICKTKYILGIDSDNSLTMNCVATFIDAWREINNSSMGDVFAEVRAFTLGCNGEKIGYKISEEYDYIDSDCIEMALKYHNDNEMISCRDVEKLRECIDFERYSWHKGELKFVSEIIFWFELAKKYKTRYLNNYLAYYFTDACDSVVRSKRDKRARINSMVNYFYAADGNIELLFKYPKFIISRIVIALVLSFAVSEPVGAMIKESSSKTMMTLIILLYLPSYIIFLKMKLIDKRF